MGPHGAARGMAGTDSGKSLVLPAPARPVPLLPTVNSSLGGACGTARELPAPHPATTAKGRGLSPPAFSVSSVLADDASTAYLTSTVAPAASRSFFILASPWWRLLHVPPASVRSWLPSGDGRDRADSLDHSTFLSPATQDDVELGLLLDGGSGPAAAAARTGRRRNANLSSMPSPAPSLPQRLAAMASTIDRWTGH